ncbi:hypothetical protein HYPSUDRAFT_62894 [Hypholoma sublateritium FD-334 SS-4]|uniref:Uncharacterized protein n=1 Tax=Hypholoma sublateritium (strain FD-334 SS-4) TaxID=945553 RepID=A0A0D2PAC5_HYPSF|nr:hypothetical protein HYPSUDRAFT_62894 [Hypholoma sublateritium FD-334 SS-4]
MDLSTSLSAPDVSSLDRNEVIGAILSCCKPNLLLGALFGHVGRFRNPAASMVSLNALKSRFLHLSRRVRSLEAINSSLEAENAAVRAEIALLRDELQTSRVRLYAEVEQRRKDALYIQQVDERINDLVSQVRRYGDFIHILAGIGINNPVYRAALSIMSNAEAEDALVASIMKAAKDKQSPWSQIVPAVVEPRSPEQCVSAINLTLRTRKDLREREKVCEFWKTTAELETSNTNLLTPSTLMDINCSCNPDVPSKVKPTVLDDMLKDLKNNVLSESSPSPVSSVTFKSMAEWAENAAKEECFGELCPSGVCEGALHGPNLNLSQPKACEQSLKDSFDGINLHQSLSDHRLPSSGSEYLQINEHATGGEPASTFPQTVIYPCDCQIVR